MDLIDFIENKVVANRLCANYEDSVQIMGTPGQFLGNFWALIERDGNRTIRDDHAWNRLLGKEPPC
jgi:hypothetical protein